MANEPTGRETSAPKDRKTPIILGVLTLIGVLATAVLGNWDKLAGKKKDDDKATSVPPSRNPISPSVSGAGNVQVTGTNNTVSIGAPPNSKPCRDPSHGIERYARTFNVSRSSAWMGGGNTQPQWCDQVVAALRGEHPGGEFRVVASSENSESKCQPFNCPQYMYHCTVEVKADPVYFERLTSSCK